jgi:hypothetical protein
VEEVGNLYMETVADSERGSRFVLRRRKRKEQRAI